MDAISESSLSWNDGLTSCHQAFCVRLVKLVCFVVAMVLGTATLPKTACQAQILDSFTEPLETVRLSAAEAGRISKVHVDLGQQVQAGDLLVALDTSVFEWSRQIAAAKANANGNIRFAQTELKINSDRLEKLKSVSSNGHASVNELEKARSEVASAKARLQAAEDEQELNLLEVQRMDAQIEQRRVRSPINGIVIELLHKTGEYIPASQPETAVVADLSSLRAKFHLSTSQAKTLKPKQMVSLLLTTENETVTGLVEYVAPVTSAKSLTVRVDVVIDNEHDQIRSGIPIRLLLD